MWGTVIFVIFVLFILIPLVVVIIINTSEFVSKGREEANLTEKHNVQTAVVAYTYEHTDPKKGMVLPTGPFMAGTRGGDLAPYLQDNLNCTYTIDAAGEVTSQTGCLK